MQKEIRGKKATLRRPFWAVEWVKDAGIPLKIATIVSRKNLDDLPRIADEIIHNSNYMPRTWRLLEYDKRGDDNIGQDDYPLEPGLFAAIETDMQNAFAASDVQVAGCSNTQSQGCLLVDPMGVVKVPWDGFNGVDFYPLGNYLLQGIDWLVQFKHPNELIAYLAFESKVQPVERIPCQSPQAKLRLR